MKNEEYDYTNPSHYKNSGKEVYKMMINVWGLENYLLFCEMNAFKYRMRLGNKPDNSIEQEFSKIEWYENMAKQIRNEKNSEHELRGDNPEGVPPT